MATKAAAKIVAEFSMEKETKNAIQFLEDKPSNGSRPPIGTLYVTKEALNGLGDFKRLRVTVEPI